MTSCQLLSACLDYIINNYIIKRTYYYQQRVAPTDDGDGGSF